MKKTNKKGFTLIELLAVIIILGVLMIIAIPSVTEYISSSRKKAYIDTAKQYISTVVNKVNQADTLKFFATDTLYLVKVGHEDACISLEKGGQSPFNDEWSYAYVGVTYDGNGYDYYYMSEDKSGQGIKFDIQSNLKEDDYDDIVTTDVPDLSALSALATGNHMINDDAVCTQPSGEVCTTAPYSAALLGAIKDKVPTNVSNIVIVNPTGGTCTYTG